MPGSDDSNLHIEEGTLLLLGRKIDYNDLPNLIMGDLIVSDPVLIKEVMKMHRVKEVHGNVILFNAHIRTFSGIGKDCFKLIDGSLRVNTAISECLLGVMRIKRLKELDCDTSMRFTRCTGDGTPFHIVNNHLHSEDRDMLACKEQLMSAGYKNLAKL